MASPSGSSGGRVLGIEGTAWAASAAVFDREADAVHVVSDPYEPETGGIHPREAAEHMREAVPRVVEEALDAAATGTDDLPAPPDDAPPVDTVAFSRGPGLGPCLRIVGSAARALAGQLDVPLVGVNHMLAHLEIGRHRAGFDWPVCLNASGANAHVLAYRGGRYRVLGETMDTGVGNAIDKFARHAGWSHPGGPKVEAAAADGEYVELPYVVKGMDFSFAGITSAAQEAYDDGVPVEDICAGLQETVFGMLTEVAERALSLTGRDELVLGGGVGQNARLREMLDAMCEARDAAFYAPEPEFLRDNAGMIAVLGSKMARAGETIAVPDSAVDPDYRPDEVSVTWHEGSPPEPDPEHARRGAEAVIDVEDGLVRKRRVPKPYRQPDLDDRLRRDRLVQEARLLSHARRQGVPTPVVFDVDVPPRELTLEHVGAFDLRDGLTPDRVRAVASHLATLHAAGVVHGDPTARNARVAPDESPVAAPASDARPSVDAGSEMSSDAASDADPGRVYLIDFGLGYYTDDVEDFAMDLHVFGQSIEGTTGDADRLLSAVRDAYADRGDERVLDRLAAIRGRGRYR